jgi:endoglucanase
MVRGRKEIRMRSPFAVAAITSAPGTALATALVGALLVASAGPAAAENAVLGPSTMLYIDPQSSTQQAAAKLDGQARADALVLAGFPSATWFTKGTPAEVQAAVKKLVDAAAAKNAVPTVVAYNLPHRDCSQYSAGGATSKAEYQAWIDAFAAGIADRKVVVILEPDGLGIIPFHTDLSGKEEWCKPAEADKATAAKERYEMLNHAVDKLRANPRSAVYLDGTHSAWLSVGDIASRLVKAGVQRASGFFINVSNYEPNDKLVDYGTWVSQCIQYGTHGEGTGHFEKCASQYYPASPSDYATWAKSRKWYADNVKPAGPLTHFVMDTSRNGKGSWAPKPGTNYKDAQTWCNPPDRGLGVRPTTRTGNPLIDAFLWIKIPGESDGPCDRGMGGGTDPVRGSADPPAGAWFEKQAAELLQLANPPVARPAAAKKQK